MLLYESDLPLQFGGLGFFPFVIPINITDCSYSLLISQRLNLCNEIDLFVRVTARRPIGLVFLYAIVFPGMIA